MKRSIRLSQNIRLSLSIVLTFACLASASILPGEEPALNAPGENLTLIITGARGDIGNICVALYANEEQWENRKPEVCTAVIPVRQGSTTHVFQNIPVGTYAVKAFHDTNTNLQIDKDTIGKPTEAYGFSRNARGRFGPPPFKAASFPFTTSQRIEIALQ